MKTMLLGLGLMALCACGGSSDNTGNTPDGSTPVDANHPATDAPAGTDAPQAVDAPPPVDAGFDAPPTVGDGGKVVCGAAPCTGNDVCCGSVGDAGFTESCQASCGDGGATINCAGPENCTAAAPLCCGTFHLGGSGFACTIDSASSDCTTTCTTQLAFPPCPATDTARLCRVGADCASDTQDPNCCDFQGVRICVSNGLKQGLTCH